MQPEHDQLRVPPQSVPYEQNVLGALMQVPDSLPLVSDWLHVEDFYRRDHQLIYRSILELDERRKPYDCIVVGEWMESQGLAEYVANGAYLIELSSHTASASNIVAYAEGICDKARLRRLIEIGTGAVNAGFLPDGRETAEVIGEVQAQFADLEVRERGGLVRAAESMGSWFDDFMQRLENGNRMTGLVTPWADLNEATRGLQPGELTIAAGRPSMGKSVFGLNMALCAAMQDVRTAVFSLEMSRKQCNTRCIASLGKIPHRWLLAPDVVDGPDYSPQMNLAMKDIKRAPLYIDDTPSLTVRQFEARARRLHRREPIGFLVIDHLHEFSIDPKLARFEYARVAQAAKNLAKEWNIPVLMLAQLNRNVTGRAEKRPTLPDLAESGAIEQKADLILFLHREDYYDTPGQTTHLQGVVELHIAKGRDIRAGQRINLRNSYGEMRLDDWQGPLPMPAMVDEDAAPKRAWRPRAVGSNARQVAS